MKKIALLIIIVTFTGCSDRKTVKPAGITGEYPVIDVGSIAGKYQRVYCSDYFSSIELIPLETNDNCLIGTVRLENIVFVNDSLIFFISDHATGNVTYSWMPRDLFVFDRSGKFLNKIGRLGQGPGEFKGIQYVYLNPEKPTVFVDDQLCLFEYDFSGKFVRSFPKPNVLSILKDLSIYAGNNLFFGSVGYNSFKRGNNYFLFDRTGEIVKNFPDRYFLDTDVQGNIRIAASMSFRIDEHLYIKDRGINDTVYLIENLNLKPVCVFDFGKYTYPLGEMNEEGQRQIKFVDPSDASRRYFENRYIIGTPKYFFYSLFAPRSLPAPKSRFEMIAGNLITNDHFIYGIYDLAKHTNVLLDTDHHQQKGIINDINGGFSIIPRYYAGNDEIIDIWRAEDMKEMLTDEYFAKQTIKDKQVHQKLKALLEILKEDDNPVIVVAKLK